MLPDLRRDSEGRLNDPGTPQMPTGKEESLTSVWMLLLSQVHILHPISCGGGCWTDSQQGW